MASLEPVGIVFDNLLFSPVQRLARSRFGDVEPVSEFRQRTGPDVVGPILDSTIIKRQRTKELNAQCDYPENAAVGAEA